MTIDVNALELIETKKLHDELRRLLVLTAETISDCASVYAELSSRGEDCPYVPNSIAQALTLVSDRLLTPEAALAFGNSAAKTRLIAGLEHWNQRRLSSGQPIDIAVRHGERYRCVSIPGPSLSVKSLELAVVNGRLLTYEEQVARSGDLQEAAPEPAFRKMWLLFPPDLLGDLQKLADRRKILVRDLVIELLRDALKKVTVKK